MLRPGRLDKIVFVPLPSSSDRINIMRTTCAKMPLAGDVDLAVIAADARAEGFSGADINARAREAATAAIEQILHGGVSGGVGGDSSVEIYILEMVSHLSSHRSIPFVLLSLFLLPSIYIHISYNSSNLLSHHRWLASRPSQLTAPTLKSPSPKCFPPSPRRTNLYSRGFRELFGEFDRFLLQLPAALLVKLTQSDPVA